MIPHQKGKTMNITIEKAKSEDAASIIAFLEQIGRETDNLAFGSEGLSLTVEALIAKLEGFNDNVMFVAKHDGIIVGAASLNRMHRRMNHRGDFGVSVAKAYWNQGIGGMLLREILNFANDNGLEILDLQVRSDNYAAIHLYEKFGFKKLCTYPGFIKIEDQYIDFDYMYLTL